MKKDEKVSLDKVKVDEIKNEILQNLQKYIDSKLKPIMNYFEKKRDFYEMSFL